jgi:predicted nicotinamide N-methyase
VLELGSGVGLTGLTIINFCSPKVYYFSDGHPIVLKILQENIRLNLLEQQKRFLWKEILVSDKIQFESSNSDRNIKVDLINLKWEDISTLHTEQMDIDLIIAADVLYDKSIFESLVCGLRDLMSNSVNYAIIAAVVRNESTILEFLNILSKYISLFAFVAFDKQNKILHEIYTLYILCYR